MSKKLAVIVFGIASAGGLALGGWGLWGGGSDRCDDAKSTWLEYDDEANDAAERQRLYPRSEVKERLDARLHGDLTDEEAMLEAQRLAARVVVRNPDCFDVGQVAEAEELLDR